MGIQITAENALEMAKYIIQEYYRLNIELFFSIMTKDCVWILPGGEIAIGLEAMRGRFKDGFEMPTFTVEDLALERLDTGSPNQLCIFGTYLLYSDVESEMIFAEKQRISLLFRRVKKDSYKCYHLHVSGEWLNLREDEIFPVQVSRETYHYMQKLIESNAKSAPVVLESESATYRFDPDMVLYVEAASKVCTVHLLGRTMVIKQSISSVERHFPEHFFRIHRSYLINCRFATQIERYTVTMVDGTTLPIPEKRFMEVRAGVTAKMKK